MTSENPPEQHQDVKTAEVHQLNMMLPWISIDMGRCSAPVLADNSVAAQVSSCSGSQQVVLEVGRAQAAGTAVFRGPLVEIDSAVEGALYCLATVGDIR